MNKEFVCATGLTSLIGSRVRELTKDKIKWINFDKSTGIDIIDQNTIEKAICRTNCEVLVHFAAFVNADKAWEQREDKNGICYKTNVEGSINVARACYKSNKYLIHISTGYVFSGEKNSSYIETDKSNPIDWYGKTKYRAEKEIQRFGNNFLIARLSHAFRASFKPKTDIVRKILIGLRENSLPPMFNDSLITPTFIDDIASALYKIIQHRPKGVLHIVGSSALTPYELARKVSSIFGFNSGIIQSGSLNEYLKNSNRRPYPKNQSLSNKKLMAELGIEMKSIDKALIILRDQMHKQKE